MATAGSAGGGNGGGGSKADPAVLEEVVDACHAPSRNWTGKLMVRSFVFSVCVLRLDFGVRWALGVI